MEKIIQDCFSDLFNSHFLTVYKIGRVNTDIVTPILHYGNRQFFLVFEKLWYTLFGKEKF